MDIAKIKKQYRNQWVLIEYTKLDKHLHPKAGRVIAHAANKEDIYKALLQTKGKNVSVEYCGEVSKDIAVMFSGAASEGIVRFQTFSIERHGLNVGPIPSVQTQSLVAVQLAQDLSLRSR